MLPSLRHFKRHTSCLTPLLFVLCHQVSAIAAQQLHCEVTNAGSTHVLESRGGSNPYTTESIDIDGRFRFKAVLLGSEQQIDTIKLYAYYETRRQPVLIQQVTYKQPFASGEDTYALTGHQYLYGPPLGRELQYGCALREVKP